MPIADDSHTAAAYVQAPADTNTSLLVLSITIKQPACFSLALYTHTAMPSTPSIAL